MNQIYACREGKETPSTDAKITSTATTPTRSVSRSIVSKLLLGVFLFLVFGATKIFAQSTVTFNASGTFTYVVPPGVFSMTFGVTGAGGGGAGSINAGGTSSSGGGGGGGSFGLTTVAVTPGNTLEIVVGSLGAGGAAGLSGQPGGFSRVRQILPVAGPAILLQDGGAGGAIITGGNPGTNNVSGGFGGQQGR